MIATVSGGQALWFMTRATGLVSLVLLTASVALGIMEVTRWSTPRFPRFVTAALHKNISLLVVVFLAVHIVTAIGDNFAPIGWLDVIVPFHSPYRPIWLGLGAVAVDLLIALIVTSLLRARIGYRVWRAVHWTAYACWPVALLHALGTGSDTRVRWALLLSLGLLVVVCLALAVRLAIAHATPVARRGWAGLGAAALVVAMVAWAYTGPLQRGWARRAGTPVALLGGSTRSASNVVTAPATLRFPFEASITGTLQQTSNGGDRTTVTIGGALSGAVRGTVRVVLVGTELAGGGVAMDRSSATLGSSTQPNLYQGEVVALDGTNISARVHDATGRAVLLAMRLKVDPNTNAVTGSVSARTGGN